MINIHRGMTITSNMKSNKSIPIIIIILTAFLISACGGNVGTGSSWAGLSADAENAYVAFGTHVYSINLENGTEKWRYPTEVKAQRTFYAAPTLTADGQLIVGDYSNVLHSINPSSGAENWSYDGATDRYVGSALATQRSHIRTQRRA